MALATAGEVMQELRPFLDGGSRRRSALREWVRESARIHSSSRAATTPTDKTEEPEFFARLAADIHSGDHYQVAAAIGEGGEFAYSTMRVAGGPTKRRLPELGS